MVRAPVLIHLVRPFVLTLFPHQLPQAKFDITGQGTILDADKSARPAAPVLRTPPVRTAAPMEGVADDLLTRSSRKRCLPLDSPRPPQRCMNVTLTRFASPTALAALAPCTTHIAPTTPTTLTAFAQATHRRSLPSSALCTLARRAPERKSTTLGNLGAPLTLTRCPSQGAQP